MTNFDIENTSDNYGFYDSLSDQITIYLYEIYSDFKKNNGVHDGRLIHTIIDVLAHENIHKLIDECLDEPELIDDHKIYKYLDNL